MKSILTTLLLTASIQLLVMTTVEAQNPIPNAGFENWSGNQPFGWTAINIPGFESITKSTDAYSGSFAVRGEVVNIGGFPQPPVLYSGSQTQQTFPLSEHHNNFTGRYKFSPQGGDQLFIEIVFGNFSINGGAEGHAEIAAGASAYEEIEIVMNYDANNPPNWQPDHGNITVTILPPQNQSPHFGTWYLLDHFTFDNYPVGVKEIESNNPEKFILEQNYPNPFNPSTTFQFSLSGESFVNLKIFNIQGEEIAELINKKLTAGMYKSSWDAEGFAAGTYIYVFRTNANVLSGKMILLK